MSASSRRPAGDPADALGALAGKVALVTGGGVNLGRAVACRFAAEGARVCVVGRREAPLRETVARIERAGGQALAVPADVTELAQVERAVTRTTERFGAPDVLAAFAGGGGSDEAIDAIDPAWWAQTIQVNLVGTFHAVRAVLPGMRARGSGTILTCAGGGALFPLEGARATAYASAKAGLCRFTDQLAVELLGTGIRVNCVLPAMTWSEGALAEVERQEAESGAPHPARAHNRPPEETAELALWLASEASAPLFGRTIATTEDWWRDPDKVARVHASVHAACLRRVEPELA